VKPLPPSIWVVGSNPGQCQTSTSELSIGGIVCIYAF
jgi:hypothetical protein